MAVISVRVPDNEYKYVEEFAKFKGINLSEYIRVLIEKQINWATKYIEDLEDVTMELDLSGVYKLVTQISYYLSQLNL